MQPLLHASGEQLWPASSRLFFFREQWPNTASSGCMILLPRASSSSSLPCGEKRLHRQAVMRFFRGWRAAKLAGNGPSPRQAVASHKQWLASWPSSHDRRSSSSPSCLAISGQREGEHLLAVSSGRVPGEQRSKSMAITFLGEARSPVARRRQVLVSPTSRGLGLNGRWAQAQAIIPSVPTGSRIFLNKVQGRY
ncbi:hypothetical protein Dimus_038683 [Dionaea muscipula]